MRSFPKIEKPFQTSPATLFEVLQTSPQGLTEAEARSRWEELGPNQIELKKRRTAVAILFSQLQNWLMLVLIAAALVSFSLGERVDSLVILGIVLLSILFGFFQEYRAERTLESLKKFISHQARVLRDGQVKKINAALLTVGDIVLVRLGDRIPADLRLLEAHNLTTDEMLITGESLPAVKAPGPLRLTDPAVAEQKNMLFAGSTVSSGEGRGVVVAVGAATYLGQTAKRLEQPEPPTEFQKQLRAFSRFLLGIILALTVFVFLANALLGKGYLNSFLFAVALAVGVTPELLPMIITVTLSQGALQMARLKVVVKKLVSVEDLGNIDTLCTDKTGTLTIGKFTLKNYLDDHFATSEKVLLDALACVNAGRAGVLPPSDLDRAIWEAPVSKRLRPQLEKTEILGENEFDFDRRRESVLLQVGESRRLIVMGAPESVFAQCQFSSSAEKRKAWNWIEKAENQGNRIIALATKETTKTRVTSRDETNLSWEGLLVFTDPIKGTAQKSLDLFRQLGVNIKIISGDSPRVVKRVAMAVGLARENTPVALGSELEKLNPAQFEEWARKYTLFARTTPTQKERLIASLNREGHIVGFLGDGFNDAPALKSADVGIAVDNGSETAKEAADIVLLEKDLAVLAQGIEAGRKIFGNINKYIFNTISANYGNMFTVAISSLFLKFIPLLPTQILLNNFISDIPLLAIATDNVDEDFVKKPKRWNIPLIGRFMVYFGSLSSIFDFATILPLLYVSQLSPGPFRTAWFIESAISEIIITFAIRTRKPFQKSRPSGWLLGLSLGSLAAVLALPYTRAGKVLFNFSSLSLPVLGWIALVLLTYFTAAEIGKKRFFRKFEI